MMQQQQQEDRTARRPSLTVVIPTFNRRDLAVRAVRSVLDQGNSVEAIVVVDDGSQDGTGTALRQFGSRVDYHYQANAGVIAARNRGWQIAGTNLVAFLDSDDVWLPGMAEVACQALTEHADAVATFVNGIVRGVGHDEEILASRPPLASSGSDFVRVRGIQAALMTPVTSGIVMRKTALQLTGGFDPASPYYEDFDLWTRLALLGDWVICVHPKWVLHRDAMEESNMSAWCDSRPLDAHASMLRYYARLKRARPRTLGDRMQLAQMIGYERSLCGALAIEAGRRGGYRILLASILDWPSPRRVARVVKLLLGFGLPGLRK